MIQLVYMLILRLNWVFFRYNAVIAVRDYSINTSFSYPTSNFQKI